MGVLVDLTEYRKAKDIQTILIVDDDQIFVSLLEEFIKSEFPEMAQLLAYNGIEALDQLSRQIPSLLIIGMYMPRLTGAEVLKNLKGKGIIIPALMVSGNIKNKEEVINLSGYPDNCLSFLRKPFKLELLADTIRSLLHND
jgi:CheY-like chemotaxis protein